MKDLYDLIQFSQDNPNAWSENYVLAVVVHTEGHAYRRAGARLLSKKGRKVFGAVSGGGLEEGVAVDAGRMSPDCRAKRVDYDSRSASDLIWGTATGAGGVGFGLLPRGGLRSAKCCALSN